MENNVKPLQIPLNVKLRDGFRFESFYCGAASENLETVSILQNFLASDTLSQRSPQNILWGDAQSGKTHLLQACCAELSDFHHTISYIPLKTHQEFGSGVLSGLSQSSFIVIDDVDIVIGDKDWEDALFNLINLVRESNQKLLMSTTQNPRLLNCVLPDLASRLIWGGSYQLQALSDEGMFKALQLRAKQRGFVLTDQVVSYISRRYPRDINKLLTILDKLDEGSLSQKQGEITIPLFKKVLGIE